MQTSTLHGVDVFLRYYGKTIVERHAQHRKSDYA